MQPRYLIGTLFEEEQQSKKTNASNMKARDPNGNVRWKGAFYGGNQAGFKNTCGSKEGWAPASFVSSIAKRAEKIEQNVFDFMDKEDIGRQSISQNISLKKDFQNSGKNSLNVRLKQSIGQRILDKLKKEEAFEHAPQNAEDLAKLLQKYAKQQEIQELDTNYDFHLKDISFHHSVGDQNNQFEDDDFIANYEDFFKKVIRDRAKEESEEEIAKRREQNKVYFDFTKPLEEEPEYLKEIQEVEQTSKPRKRRKNVLNALNLKQLFIDGGSMRQFDMVSQLPKAPEEYDPYHRLRALKQKQRQKYLSTEHKQQHRPKVLNIRQRSDILGQAKLSDKFRASSSQIKTSSFVRSSQQSAQEANQEQLKKLFQDEKKNLRYHDYIMELQGKKISAQLQYHSWQEGEKEKAEFEKMYNLQSTSKGQMKEGKIQMDLQKALTSKGVKGKQIVIRRSIIQWKPERLLCKRFNILVPHSSS